MLPQLINLSPDIKKLADEGYELELNGAYLLVRHIPYVNSKIEVKYGTIVTVLTLAGPCRTAPPQDHTVFFCGDIPCNAQGHALTSIINSSGNQQLTPSILINHFFSSKPATGKYADFYEKIRTYSEILGAQARVIDPGATSRPLRPPKETSSDSIFMYPDTNSARAKIDFLNSKFHGQRIGIIGLGGTGSYILDLVSKTPVREINIFDGDVFHLHNAFRAPGTPNGENMNQNGDLAKADYYYEIYSRMHKGIKVHKDFVTSENVAYLADLDFVFVCVDSNRVRHFLITNLLRLGIPFIDVGLGVNLVEDSLIGTLRVTTASTLKNDHLKDRVGQDDQPVNEYNQNIQIADLNCLNAVLAVIKWKKMIGFYQDLKHEHNSLYFINTGKLINDDLTI